MNTSTPIPLARRWLESFLVWYAVFLIAYLVLRFIVQVNWNLFLLLHNGAPYLFLPVIVGFILALLMGARRFAGVYFLLMVLGALWLVPILAPKSQSVSEDSLRMNLISFNFYPYNEDTDTAIAWLLAQDADILALQEVHGNLSALDADFPYSAQSSNLAIFSRYPIQVSGEFLLGDSPQQRAILDINGQNIVLYNLHLLMPLNMNEGDFILLRYDETLRNQQIDTLVSNASEESLPVMLIGDFNMSDWSPIYQSLSANFKDAYRESSWGIGATFPAGESEELPDIFPRLVRLDYLWYSEGFVPVTAYVGQDLGSDHLPLVVEMAME